MAAFVVSAAVALSSMLWLVRLGLTDTGLDTAAGVMIGVGLLVLALVAVAALMLAHAPWGRALAVGVVAVQLVLAIALDWTVMSAVAAAVTLLALGGLAGPWLLPWLRRLPPADGVGSRPMTLALSLVGFPLLAGLAAIDTASASHVAAAVALPLMGWAFATGHVAGLWAARLLVLPACVWVAMDSALPWSIVVPGAGAVIGALAWAPESARAVQPLYVSLPGPRHGKPIVGGEQQ